jgi:hypothetical protein
MPHRTKTRPGVVTLIDPRSGTRVTVAETAEPKFRALGYTRPAPKAPAARPARKTKQEQ